MLYKVLADYCPFMQQVSWSINNEIRDSKCSFEENKPDKNKNYILEQYGKSSKCFLHNRTWQIYSDKCQSRITVSKTIGCYKYECNPRLGLLVSHHICLSKSISFRTFGIKTLCIKYHKILLFNVGTSNLLHIFLWTHLFQAIIR